MEITKIQGLDKKWQETILRILCDYNNDQDKLAAIDRINELTGLGVLYSGEVFKKLVSEFELSAGVVKNFAHELTKEPHTEALNKHNVMGRSELLCLACHQEPATRGIGDRKTVCSKCWNIAASETQ